MCITNNKKDLIRLIKSTQNGKVNGISGAMGITGPGKVRWSMIDTTGKLQHIELQCCHALSATQVLLSTLVLCEAHPKNSIMLNSKSWTVQLNLDELNKNAFDINMSLHDNLPTTKHIHADSLSNLAVNFSKNLTVTCASNHNLDEPQKRNCCAGTANWDTEICETFKSC